MKFATTLLPLAAITTAFVIPDEAAAKQITFEKSNTFLDDVRDNVKDIWSSAEDRIHEAVKIGGNALDAAFDTATHAGKQAAKSIECYESMVRFETQAWLDSASDSFEPPRHRGPRPPHDGDHPPPPPPHGRPPPPPRDGKPPHDKPPHDGPPHHGEPPHHGPPHHGPHHGDHKPNQTVYELIASSKYTTKLAKLINDYPELVKALNGTAANYTVFAPTDKAFEKIPKHHEKPSKEVIAKVLAYHVSPHFYPAGRLLLTHTVPTAFNSSELGDNPQRLRVGLSLKGLTVNFYSRVVAANIFATNGVIHGVDSLLIPPPEISKIIDILPGEFSTLQLGLIKSGLGEELEKHKHTNGGTFFAPSNFAFQKLGPRINAFLFSQHGLKYLKALLQYHVVPDQTLYSDAFYGPSSSEVMVKDHLHYDLPTLLKDKNLSIDIGRFAGFLTFKINAFNDVSILDGIARDGVIQVVSSVIIPPKSPGESAVEVIEDMDLEEFKQLLIPSEYAQEL